jgi:hypothetical protein
MGLAVCEIKTKKRKSEETATKLILNLFSDSDIKDNLILLKEIGANLNEVLKERPEILKYPTEKIKARLNELRFLQVKNIEKVITESPDLLIMPYENIEKLINCLKEFGIGIGIRSTPGNMIENYPRLITKLITQYNPEDIRDKLKYLLHQLRIGVTTIEKNLYLLECDVNKTDNRVGYLKERLGRDIFDKLSDEDKVKLVTLPEDEFNDFTEKLIKKYSKKKIENEYKKSYSRF